MKSAMQSFLEPVFSRALALSDWRIFRMHNRSPSMAETFTSLQVGAACAGPIQAQGLSAEVVEAVYSLANAVYNGSGPMTCRSLGVCLFGSSLRLVCASHATPLLFFFLSSVHFLIHCVGGGGESVLEHERLVIKVTDSLL